MKILTTAKRVIDPYTKVKPLENGMGIDTTGIKYDINPFDEIAIEEAVRIKEKIPTAEIIVASIGTSECEEQLRKALAMGADKAILIETPHELDSPGIALELMELAKKIQPDIILMGKQATDDDCNQAAQMLAAKINIPQATFASKIEIEGQNVKVTRETDTGEETLGMSIPCLITADLRLNQPRYIPLPGIIKARTKPLEKIPATHAAQPKTCVIAIELPPPRTAGIKVESVAALVNTLKEKGVL